MQWWKEKWPHTVQGFKTYTNFAVFTWGECSDSHYMYCKPSFKSCRANKKYTIIRN